MNRFAKHDIISLTQETPRYDLGESVGPDLRLGELFDPDERDELSELALSYGTAPGEPRLRELLAEIHGVRSDQVVTTIGGMHTLFLLAFILCDPRDTALTTTPEFPLWRRALEAVGARVQGLALSFDDGYRLNPDRLGQTLSEDTRLVGIATPQNPSGVAIPRQTVEEILGVMADRCPDAYLLVDETYREAAYGDDSVAPTCATLSPRVVSCASLSKCHGAPGLRLGWAIATDPKLYEQLVLGKFTTVVSCSPVIEHLALKTLEQRSRILGERRVHLAQGLAKTAAWVERNAAYVDWVRPDAGALCCVRLKPTVFDEVAVARFYEVLPAKGVRVGSGEWFGEDRRIFRLGFGFLSPAHLDSALQGLQAALTDSLA